MLENTLKERGVMPIWNEKAMNWETRRKEIVELLCREEYGFMPREHDKLTWIEEPEGEIFCAGHADRKKVVLTAHFGEDSFSFPIDASIPRKKGKLPFFVHINFSDHVPDKYLPVEEICDRGYAVISFCYNDVLMDELVQKVESNPLAEILYKGIEKQPYHAGQIRIWAWAASRALDYALTLDCLDSARTAVIGHSRLGKTALVAGMLDERFQMIISNDSGAGGAAIARGKIGERVEDSIRIIPAWYCENYKKYAGKQSDMPFDQHFLIAACAPRYVYAASAETDSWADPVSEFLSCYAADEVYRKLGLVGLVCDDRLPAAFEKYHEGQIGYHIRKGDHYLSREDWKQYMDYMEKHLK